MRHSRLAALSLMLVVLAAPSHAAGVRHRNVELKGGIADISGSISGDRSIEYEFSSPGAQVVGIGLKTRHKMAYFDLLPAGSEDPIFNGSLSGRNFLGELPAAGLYRVRVYLMRDAAHRQESASYTLSISLRDSNKPGAGSEAAAAAAPAAVANDGAPRGATGEGRAPATDRAARVQVPFDQSLAVQGITFRVQSPNAGVPNKVLITPEGLSIDNSAIARPVDGLVTGAEVADLNGDGSPELYVYVRGTDAQARASLVAYSANRKRSLSDVYLPPLDETPGNAQGYQGHDDMRTAGDALLHRFPVYRSGDAAGAPSGGTRELRYKLRAGEAGWRLVLDRVVAY